MARLKVRRLELGPYGTNAYILVCAATGAAVLIDAPGPARDILAALSGREVEYILITHGHGDHLGALPELKRALNAPVAVHPADARRLPFNPDRLLQDGETISVGEVTLKVIHTPGHTPGSVCFYSPGDLFSGDTLFPNGPGKTATPRDFRQIVESITGKLFVLPDDTRVYPGHGEGTELGREKALFNEFNRRPHAPDLCGDVFWVPPT